MDKFRINGSVRWSGIVEGRDMLARDDERVDGRVRIDVAEGDRLLVLVNNIGGNLARDDATEDAIWLGHIFC